MSTILNRSNLSHIAYDTCVNGFILGRESILSRKIDTMLSSLLPPATKKVVKIVMSIIPVAIVSFFVPQFITIPLLITLSIIRAIVHHKTKEQEKGLEQQDRLDESENPSSPIEQKQDGLKEEKFSFSPSIEIGLAISEIIRGVIDTVKSVKIIVLHSSTIPEAAIKNLLSAQVALIFSLTTLFFSHNFISDCKDMVCELFPFLSSNNPELA